MPEALITDVTVTSLRGIGRGTLTGLTPLTVLTGPNSSGKSTILDALLLACASTPEDAVGRVVRRRAGMRGGADWVVRSDAPDRMALVKVGGAEWEETVAIRHQGAPSNAWVTLANGADLRPPLTLLSWHFVPQGTDIVGTGAVVGVDGRYVSSFHVRPGRKSARFTRLIEPDVTTSLSEAYSNAVRTGQKAAILDLLRDVLPDLENLEILTDTEGEPDLYLIHATGAVPAGLAGEGIQSLLRLALQLGGMRGGLALVEEPEAHQHPAALRQSARALVAAMRRGTQVVVTTHSIELLDHLLDAVGEADTDRMSVFNLALHQGELRSVRTAGRDITFARAEIHEDLR